MMKNGFGVIENYSATKQSPTLTRDEVIDCLKSKHVKIQSGGTAFVRRFSWVYRAHDLLNYPECQQDDRKRLVVCDEKEVIPLAEQHPYSYYLVAVKDLNSMHIRLGEDRYIAVEGESTYELFDLLRELFISNLLWESQLDYAVYRRCGMQELLDIAGEAIQDGFMCVTDANFNLVVANASSQVPSEAYASLLATGTYQETEIAYLSKQIDSFLQRQGFFIAEPHNGNEAYSVHCPIFDEGNYVCHVTYACSDEATANATKDKLIKIAHRISMLSVNYWHDVVEFSSTCNKVFTSLIHGEKCTRMDTEIQMKRAGIPTVASYRLVSIGFPQDFHFEKERHLVEAAKSLNNGDSHVFLMGRKLLVLIYNADKSPLPNSLFKIIKELDEYIYRPYNITAGVSQIFSDIKDIDYAYKQCEIAIQNREALVRLFPNGYREVVGNAWPCYPFDHVLPFISIGPNMDSELVQRSMRDNNLMKTLRGDKGFESESVDIIWLYLVSERNATKAATLGHVHRNTVLYQIKKFEDRYDVNLDLPMVRLRIRFDFMYWMMNTSK